MQYQMANGLMQYQLTVKAATNRQLMKNGEELLRNNYAVNGFNTRPCLRVGHFLAASAF